MYHSICMTVQLHLYIFAIKTNTCLRMHNRFVQSPYFVKILKQLLTHQCHYYNDRFLINTWATLENTIGFFYGKHCLVFAFILHNPQITFLLFPSLTNDRVRIEREERQCDLLCFLLLLFRLCVYKYSKRLAKKYIERITLYVGIKNTQCSLVNVLAYFLNVQKIFNEWLLKW